MILCCKKTNNNYCKGLIYQEAPEIEDVREKLSAQSDPLKEKIGEFMTATKDWDFPKVESADESPDWKINTFANKQKLAHRLAELNYPTDTTVSVDQQSGFMGTNISIILNGNEFMAVGLKSPQSGFIKALNKIERHDEKEAETTRSFKKWLPKAQGLLAGAAEINTSANQQRLAGKLTKAEVPIDSTIKIKTFRGAMGRNFVEIYINDTRYQGRHTRSYTSAFKGALKKIELKK